MLANKFMVGMLGELVTILGSVPSVMNKKDALNLAAYIVAITSGEEELTSLLREIEGE